MNPSVDAVLAKLLPFKEAGWNFDAARLLATQVEGIAPNFGAHVALTGGCLYKDGARKDCDLVFYRIRQKDNIDVDGLLVSLAMLLGIQRLRGSGFCIKASFFGRGVDLLFPEHQDGQYEPGIK